MNIYQKIRLIIKDASLRNRILFVMFAFVLFRLLAAVPIPGIDSALIANFLQDNQFLGLLNIFSGGGLSGLSLVMLGVGPYITASIIMQLLTVMVPSLKTMYHEEGEIGRKKFTRISRYLTVPIALVQGFGLLTLLSQQGILPGMALGQMISSLVIITAGAMLITWIGELISEFGIGNGVSLIIFAGIVGVMPQTVNQLVAIYDPTQLIMYITLAIVAILVIAAIVVINEAERPVPISYSKQSLGGQTYGQTASYLPLRVNQAGVMPIIFALAILMFPQMISSLLLSSGSFAVQGIGRALQYFVETGWLYSTVYFLLVVGFTYFYTAITFDPASTAENLQKNGAFVSGVRPGAQTEEFIGTIVGRLTCIGALFLGIVAVIPFIIQAATGMTAFTIGGTGILIVVAVVIDLIKKVDAQVAMRSY